MILQGDALDKLKTLNDNSIDCLCCDPPYGIEFMGKDWDNALPSIDIWKEVLRVMKPGAFGFIMCIPRQDCLSRMMISLEDAGFNVNFSSLYWTYATGFPKAMNIGKKIDKRLGKEREVVGEVEEGTVGFSSNPERWNNGKKTYMKQITVATSDLAKKMEGSYGGFQPKPAVEVIIVVMKPLSESGYLNQAIKDGKGVTWFDDCRIPYANEEEGGRFPANLLISDDILGEHTKFYNLDAWAQKNLPFIIVPKAPKKEKNLGCDNLEDKNRPNCIDQFPDELNKFPKTKNTHPTVKPMKLMSYLITLGSRPGDVILDPFCGSGTTGCAAITLDRKFVIIEKEEEYIAIIKARIKYFKEQQQLKPMEV